MGYSIVMTLSGVALPEGVSLNLDGAVVIQNPITLNQSDAPPIGPNATLFRQPRLPDGSFREAARYLLGFELADAVPANPQIIRAISEVTILPLRLMTKGSITISLAEVSRRPLQEMLSTGCDSIAPAVQSVQIISRLSEKDCAEIQSTLPHLRLPPDARDWQVLTVRFTEAYYKPDPIEQGLAFLVALEILATPGLESRSRSSVVQHNGALLASTESRQQRAYRKILKDGYKARAAIWHGETDPAKFAEARQWYSDHWEELRDICRHSFQRALRLRTTGRVSSLLDVTTFIIRNTNKAAHQEVWAVPVCTVGSQVKLWLLDLSRDFQVEATGSGSVQFNV